MSQRIREIIVRNHIVTPAEAEIRVDVVAEDMTAATEIRSRLVGPRCLYASTVEVAYPFLEVKRPTPEGAGLGKRVVIPEPSLWEPTCPFLYQGRIELWQDGQLQEQRQFTHGLRTLQLGTSGLRVNGNMLPIRVMDPGGDAALTHSLTTNAATWREAGYNTLLTPVAPGTTELWELADRLGFFVLGMVRDIDASPHLVKALSRHPAALGWVVPAQTRIPTDAVRGTLWGVEIDVDEEAPPPEGAHFLLRRRSFPGTFDIRFVLSYGSLSIRET